MGQIFDSFATAMGAGLMMVYGVLILLSRASCSPSHPFSLPCRSRRHQRAFDHS